MRRYEFSLAKVLVVLASLFLRVLCDDVVSSSGVTNCLSNPVVSVEYASFAFAKSTAIITYNVSGSSSRSQKVNASLIVNAYGEQVLQKSFDPCQNDTHVQQLCPIPEGKFSAIGSQMIPQNYVSKIPSFAFSIPDIDVVIKLELTSLEDGQEIACVTSGLTNGKTINLPAVTGVSCAILGASLVVVGLGSTLSAASAGGILMSPGFPAVLTWFQSMAMDGMLSVNYPPLYRSFTRNFGFSVGLIKLNTAQVAIDNFRLFTGGKTSGSEVNTTNPINLKLRDEFRDFVRDDKTIQLAPRVIKVFSSRALPPTAGLDTSAPSPTNPQNVISGIQEYADMLSIPQANTFLTVFLVFAVVVAAIVVGILGLKLILEAWALFGKFPHRLISFRKKYWRILATTLTTLILLLYGIWTIWCIFQWTLNDSWAARILAAVTWTLFTAVLAFYTLKVFMVARAHKRHDGSTSGLYENSETWHKYGFLYDSYKRGYWWVFVPVIAYAFAKGVVIAAGNGHGVIQTIAQLSIETIMLTLLLWFRPFATRASNWINIVIQVVRVLSVACILVFVEKLGLSQSTKTVTGIALIVVQSALTGILGILLAVNAIRLCIVTNPHVRRRKEAKKQREQVEKGGMPFCHVPDMRLMPTRKFGVSSFSVDSTQSHSMQA